MTLANYAYMKSEVETVQLPPAAFDRCWALVRVPPPTRHAAEAWRRCKLWQCATRDGTPVCVRHMSGGLVLPKPTQIGV